jgi:hypothetical protein
MIREVLPNNCLLQAALRSEAAGSLRSAPHHRDAPPPEEQSFR